MRIVGYIEHPVMKITVMQMNERYVVKLEANLLEQTYKFHEDDRLRTLEDVQRLIDDTFLDECLKRFGEMHRSRGEGYLRFIGEKNG
ncbi:MAG TPA: hypothetical protein PLA16_11520 [Chitinophagales bacterium]|jgi:hypothetical protein|nr:hypothetical protein [Chitinophagales bacterium]HPA36986.1 hypothetical protein [Chitinophagales bacterium]HQD11975.1 hypothetical protein [Chitinophagales bacterium]HQO90405.1 hypothetical protein [Chitinophagales bacterium]